MNNDTFTFFNKEYTLSLLQQTKVLKTYWDRSHSKRCLVQDKYGSLFHYGFEEEMRFGGDDDREDYLWIAVADEQESDALSQLSGLSLLRPPYIASDKTGWVGVHESD